MMDLYELAQGYCLNKNGLAIPIHSDWEEEV